MGKENILMNSQRLPFCLYFYEQRQNINKLTHGGDGVGDRYEDDGV